MSREYPSPSELPDYTPAKSGGRLTSYQRLKQRLRETEDSLEMANECIVMAQEQVAHLVFLSNAMNGTPAMFLPEGIRNACILVRDEALAYEEDARRAAALSTPQQEEEK